MKKRESFKNAVAQKFQLQAGKISQWFWQKVELLLALEDKL
ncbi:hypothetical protein Q0M94_17770 (plasmid) [Deinococcus radiomollis]